MDVARGVVVFRLCIDLNVWVGHFLAEANGRQGTAAQIIVGAVQDGRCGLGPVQLIVSHSMLTRLHDVLVRKGASLDTASRFIALIEALVQLGPALDFPSLVLGGGALATLDAKGPAPDAEDGRVLDAAIAGRADALVTWNFRDFVDRHDEIIERDRIHVRHTAGHALVVIQPPDLVAWMRSGTLAGRPAP